MQIFSSSFSFVFVKDLCCYGVLPGVVSMGQVFSAKRLQIAYRKMRVNVTNFTFTWEIENFSHCPQQTGEKLLSDTFSTEDSNDKWRLELSVRGVDVESKEHVSLFLNLVESDRKIVGAKFLFLLKGDDGKSYKIGKTDFLSSYQRDFKTDSPQGWGWAKFIERSYLLDRKNGLLPDDKLTIVCSMTVAGDVENVVREITKPNTCHEFGECVTLSVGGRQFNVYKSILSSNSPVFAAMLKQNTLESQTGQIDIEDTEPEAIAEMLQFLYTGSAPNLKAMADQLLLLADKYQVQPLKIECEEAMGEQLSVENACSVLVEAHQLSATRLKKYAVKFVVAHVAAVSKTEGFKSLAEHYPHLLIETFQAMAAGQ